MCLIVRLSGLFDHMMCVYVAVFAGSVFSFLFFLVCVFMCVSDRIYECACTLAWNVQLPNLTELKPTLACQEKRYKDTHTHIHTHTHGLSLPSLRAYLPNSVSFELFLSQTLTTHTHIHKHTCSPRPAKRERWLVNKQWHSTHSVTRLGFDQHRCSCSPQQCFLSFCLPNVATHVPQNARTHTHTPL